MQDDLLYWLAEICRERRDSAGLVRSAVAGSINISEERIKRFEMVAGKWPPYTGAIVEAYAAATDTTAFDIWSEALSRWHAASPAEQSHSPSTPSRAKELADQAVAAARQGQGALSRKRAGDGGR